METSSVGQYLPPTGTSTGKTYPAQAAKTAAAAKIAAEPAGPEQRLVNMRNISVNEINELIKAGHQVLLDIVPFVGLNSNDDPDAMMSKKLDYLAQIESQIDYRKSVGLPTELHENYLEKLKELHGTTFPGSLDIRA